MSDNLRKRTSGQSWPPYHLRALCHLAHDAPEHVRRAAATRAAKSAAAHRRAGQLNLI